MYGGIEPTIRPKEDRRLQKGQDNEHIANQHPSFGKR